MIFYLHYVLLTSGLCGTSVLLGVFIKNYSDASQSEIGALLMSFPFVAIVIKPLFCSMADRHLAHRGYLIGSLIVMLVGYLPFMVIPFWPAFYESQPRLSWYLMVVACVVGNGALGVGWSLGDALAVNYQQKTGVPYSRMRLMGTVSWGVYGYIIGEINEVSFLPKYLPSFIILYVSVLLEIAILIGWRAEDFEMCDSVQSTTNNNKSISEKPAPPTITPAVTVVGVPAVGAKAVVEHAAILQSEVIIDSTPSSLGGTLRLRPSAAGALREMLAAEDLSHKLEVLAAAHSQQSLNIMETLKHHNHHHINASGNKQLNQLDKMESGQVAEKSQAKNPQLMLLKMILLEDGRLTKYFLIFIMYGILYSPMSFLFMSMEELCDAGKACNFSQLAGSVLISQAAIETLGFLILPFFLKRFSRSTMLAFAMLIMFVRFFFYGNYYYSSNISPYWAVVGEWGHGLSYAIFCTILAEAALMFANESRLFIDELRSMGFLSNPTHISADRIRSEENAIRMALRATMQALFGGCMDGVGAGFGSLLCGILIENYSFAITWKFLAVLSLVTLIVYQLNEFSRSRWSDSYEPKPGTKAYEIMTLDDSVDNPEILNAPEKDQLAQNNHFTSTFKPTTIEEEEPQTAKAC